MIAPPGSSVSVLGALRTGGRAGSARSGGQDRVTATTLPLLRSSHQGHQGRSEATAPVPTPAEGTARAIARRLRAKQLGRSACDGRNPNNLLHWLQSRSIKQRGMQCCSALSFSRSCTTDRQPRASTRHHSLLAHSRGPRGWWISTKMRYRPAPATPPSESATSGTQK